MVKRTLRQLHADRAAKGANSSLKKNKEGVLVSKKKSNLAKKGPLDFYREAAKSEGYLVKGNFKPLPKKGSQGHKKIIAAMNLLRDHCPESRSRSRSRSRGHKRSRSHRSSHKRSRSRGHKRSRSRRSRSSHKRSRSKYRGPTYKEVKEAEKANSRQAYDEEPRRHRRSRARVRRHPH